MGSQAPASINTLPLHELLAFEATARLGSIARAAEELSVTGSALSHRLSSLQGRLGVKLFERKGKGIQITAEGHRYLDGIQSALRSLWARGDALRGREHGTVRVAAAPAIATAWLLPQLSELFASDPGLRLDVSTVALVEDVDGQDWDLLVHFGAHVTEGAHRVALFADSLFPVCAPSLRSANPDRLGLAEFMRLPLLRHTLLSWSRWIEGAFGERLEVDTVAYFDDATSMLEAAAAGAGVALAPGIASMPFLSSGALVAAHPYRLPDQEFYAELSEAGMLKPRARSLLAWLEGMAAGQSATSGG